MRLAERGTVSSSLVTIGTRPADAVYRFAPAAPDLVRTKITRASLPRCSSAENERGARARINLVTGQAVAPASMPTFSQNGPDDWSAGGVRPGRYSLRRESCGGPWGEAGKRKIVPAQFRPRPDHMERPRRVPSGAVAALMPRAPLLFEPRQAQAQARARQRRSTMRSCEWPTKRFVARRYASKLFPRRIEPQNYNKPSNGWANCRNCSTGMANRIPARRNLSCVDSVMVRAGSPQKPYRPSRNSKSCSRGSGERSP